ISQVPGVNLPSEGGAPGKLVDHLEGIEPTSRALLELGKRFTPRWSFELALVLRGADAAGKVALGPPGQERTLAGFLRGLDAGAKLAPEGKPPEFLVKSFDPKARQRRQFHEIDRYNQQLLAESPYVRQKFTSKLDTSSVEKFQKSAESYRDYFANE